MEKNDFLETIASRLGQNGSVKNVYGEPITAQGKTIIPVAQIAIGFGGGYGQKNGKNEKASNNSEQLENNSKDEGTGGGGGLYATAKGVYEVTDNSTRFIPANGTKQLIVIAALAFISGCWIGGGKK